MATSNKPKAYVVTIARELNSVDEASKVMSRINCSGLMPSVTDYGSSNNLSAKLRIVRDNRKFKVILKTYQRNDQAIDEAFNYLRLNKVG